MNDSIKTLVIRYEIVLNFVSISWTPNQRCYKQLVHVNVTEIIDFNGATDTGVVTSAENVDSMDITHTHLYDFPVL